MHIMGAEIQSGMHYWTHQLKPMALLRILWLSLVITFSYSRGMSAGEGKCDFPEFLQSSHPWLLNHTDTLRRHQVNGSVLTLIDCHGGEQECAEYKRLCWDDYGKNVYLVKHMEVRNTFRCVQFLQRSKSVVQVMLGPFKRGRLGTYSCQTEILDLAAWPWILEDQPPTLKTTCPFIGGYNFELSKTTDYIYKGTSKCKQTLQPVRVESDCEHGEGMMFHFRNPECLHREGNFDITQHTHCIASWSHQDNHFAIIRKDNEDYYWCLRVQYGEDGKVLKIIIFLDLICDHTMVYAKQMRYIQLDTLNKLKLLRRCTSVTNDCDNDLCTLLSDLCASTCAECDHSPKLSPCRFPHRVRGAWNRAGKDESYIDIQKDGVDLSTSGKYQCVTFSHKSRSLKRVLLKRFNNGCHPRFKCMQFDLPAPTVMRLRLGNLISWPANLSDNAICDKKHFMQHSEHKDPTHRPLESLIRRPVHPVLCNLPGRLPNVLTVYDDYGTTACLIHGAHAFPRHILLSRVRDDSVVHTISYTCLASLTFIGMYKSIITVTDTPSGPEYLCWVIVNNNFIMQVPATSCNSLTTESILAGNEGFDRKLVRSYYTANASSEAAQVCNDFFQEHYAQRMPWKPEDVTLGEVSGASGSKNVLMCVLLLLTICICI